MLVVKPRVCIKRLTVVTQFKAVVVDVVCLSFSLSVKSRCDGLGCWPLCLLTPAGGQCMCPDGKQFVANTTNVCDTGKFLVLLHVISCIAYITYT